MKPVLTLNHPPSAVGVLGTVTALAALALPSWVGRPARAFGALSNALIASRESTDVDPRGTSA